MFFGTFEENKKRILNQFKETKRNSHVTDQMNRWSFRETLGVEWNEESGQSVDVLRAKCREIEKSMQGASRAVIKTEIFSYLLENAQVAVEPWNVFASSLNHGGILKEFFDKWLDELQRGYMKPWLDKNRIAESDDVLLFTSNVDFNHVSPDWERMLRIGFPGIIAELESSHDEWRKKGISAEQEEYFACGIKAWNAVLTYLNRLADECDRRSSESDKLPVVANVCRALATRAPESTLEAMEMCFLFYRMETQIENVNLRTVGGLDRLFWRFWQTDIAEGRYTEEELTELWYYYISEYSAFGVSANLPFSIGGQYPDGTCAVNELTFKIVKIYKSLKLYDPKIHVRITKDTPRELVELVCDTIRDGETSFAFINDDAAIKALTHVGISVEDARNYILVGCYEPLALGHEVPCTCVGLVNTPKVLEVLLHNGTEPKTGAKLLDVNADKCDSFESFYQEYLKAIRQCQDSIVDTVVNYEHHYMELCPSPIYSGSMPDSVEKGVDIYAGGARYNNSSFNCIGLATCIDSLLAIKKLVFEDKELTFAQLREALDADFVGCEKLWKKCRTECKKYGNGEEEADGLTARFAHEICDSINGRPNGRGGIFRAGLLSINWGFRYGTTTGATPDGRRATKPFSKNYYATNGMDKNGVTALIRSVCSIDNVDVPNGSVFDLMLHPTTVQGEEGLQAFVDLILSYIDLGGFAIHCNLFDADVLKDAQKNPDKYATMQVRVCGWNAYFNDLSKPEQDFFIEQAECL